MEDCCSMPSIPWFVSRVVWALLLIDILQLQSVTELHDGSALFVTVAKYLSPALHQIEHVGIAPDVKCIPGDNIQTEVNPSSDNVLEGDTCIILAQHQLDLH
jgi:C-terminal processing protease CtpA/Prc